MMKEKRSPSQLEALWKESDMSNGRKVDAMVVILRTNGCCWVRQGGCTMCGYREAGYREASLTDVTEDDLLKQLEQALAKYKGEPFVKIYTSGSFLDDNEVPPEVRRRFFEAFSGCERILFESRPEFITPESLADVPPRSPWAWRAPTPQCWSAPSTRVSPRRTYAGRARWPRSPDSWSGRISCSSPRS